MVDEIWHAVGDDASDLDWYVKRTVLGGVYSTTEVYMLTDNSPGLFKALVCMVCYVGCAIINSKKYYSSRLPQSYDLPF